MRIQIRLNPDLEFVIETNRVDKAVYVMTYSGAEYEKHFDEMTPTSTIILSKATARAFASAIMGCAAEA